MAVIIQIFQKNRPYTLSCAELSSVSTIPHKQRTCEMGFGEIALLIHKFHQNRPSTRCAKLSSITTIPHKQRTCEMAFGDSICHENRPSTCCAKLSSISTIPHIMKIQM